MYGFGDDRDPCKETKELMEQYVVEYMSNMCNRVLSRSLRRGYKDMQLGDLVYMLQTDPKKYYRVPHTLEELKKSKKLQKAFDLKENNLN